MTHFRINYAIWMFEQMFLSGFKDRKLLNVWELTISFALCAGM